MASNPRRNPGWRRLTIALLALFVLESCHDEQSDDWHALFEVKSTVPGKSPISGSIFVHGDKVLFNAEAHFHMVGVLADLNRHTAVSLMHPLQSTLKMKYSEIGDRFFMRCPPTDVDGCLKRMQYKATAQEGVDGHLCQVYENTVLADGKAAHEKVWRPLDLKNVYMLRTELTMPDGSVTIARVWDVKREKFDLAMVEVPKEYRPFDKNMLPPGVRDQLPPLGH